MDDERITEHTTTTIPTVPCKIVVAIPTIIQMVDVVKPMADGNIFNHEERTLVCNQAETTVRNNQQEVTATGKIRHEITTHNPHETTTILTTPVMADNNRQDPIHHNQVATTHLSQQEVTHHNQQETTRLNHSAITHQQEVMSLHAHTLQAVQVADIMGAAVVAVDLVAAVAAEVDVEDK